MKIVGLMAVFIALAAPLRADGQPEPGQFGVSSLAFGVEAENSELEKPNSQPQPRPRPQAAVPVRQELEKEFRFRPKPDSIAARDVPPVAEQKTEKMARVVVTGFDQGRQLESDLLQRARALRELKFAPLNGGGTLLEHKGKRITSELQLKLISVRHGAGLNVFSLSW